MEEYPRTLAEFERRFATEEACRAYLAQLRWPKGVVCPRCQGQTGWQRSRPLWLCAAAGYETPVTAGTIFQDTRHPLTLWFRAIWWVTSQKTGASALGLQRILGFGSYETAWTWLHKLRRAMVRPGRRGAAAHGRKRTPKKILIAVAAEEAGRGIGRIRVRRIPDATAASLHR